MASTPSEALGLQPGEPIGAAADQGDTASGRVVPRSEEPSVRVRRPALAAAKTDWPAGAVLLCRECKRSEAKRLRKLLTRRLEAAGIRSVRPLVTSCQDLCPGRGTAVSLLVTGHAVRTYVVRSDADVEALVEALQR